MEKNKIKEPRINFRCTRSLYEAIQKTASDQNQIPSDLLRETLTDKFLN